MQIKDNRVDMDTIKGWIVVVKDNRESTGGALDAIKGRMVEIHDWGQGITITLDTGYSITLDNREVERIKERK